MVFLTTKLEQFRASVRANASLLCSVLFIAFVLVAASPGRHWALAIYALSFWHYYLYWLAYRFGAVPHGVFKRDAVLMKTVSLAALSIAYFAVPPDLFSLAVVGCGFLLNAVAAGALGTDRTYYGRQVANLPHRQITAFPYAWIPHPMLVGNILAFGGTMINADFRGQWWLLAFAHVVLNVGLLIMEVFVTPQCRGAGRATLGSAAPAPAAALMTGGCIAAAGAASGAVAAYWGMWRSGVWPGAAFGACAGMYAYAMFIWYTVPRGAPDRGREVQTEDVHV